MSKIRFKKPEFKRVDAWSSIMIHKIMIDDKIRTLSYKKAIENNVKNNDIVLDIGCGTGIFSFFVAKKGCKKVYAIDNSNIINSAIETAKLNNLDKYIKFVKRNIFKFRPKEKIDVLIHEQIGVFLWDEDMISKVAYIRDNFLKQDGIIIPYKINLYLVPTSYESDLERSISYWSRKRYGIDFSNLSRELFIHNIRSFAAPSRINLKDTKTFLCTEKSVYIIDLRKENRIPQKITASFRLRKNSKLRGICAYFKVCLDKNTAFSTRPKGTNTSWRQIFLPCIQRKVIKRDSILNFTLFPKRRVRDWKFKFEIY